MDQEHELKALVGVRERLRAQFPEIDPALVEAAVQVSHRELQGNPIRDFVPVLVEHAARDRLAFAIRNPGPFDAPSAAQPTDHDEPAATLRSVEQVF